VLPLSIVLSTQPASFSALAYKGQLAENIKKIDKMGYDGVELAVRNPELLDLKELHAIISDYNLTVPAIGTGQAYGEEGLSFTNPNPAIRKKAIERIKSHIELAAYFKAKVIIGLIRGNIEEQTDYQQAETWLIEALRECATQDETIDLVIEPLNRYECNLLNTVSETLQLIQKINVKNIGLLLDTFHMNIEEPSIFDSIEESKKYLFHFHIADSNRWYPGAGHLEFSTVVEILKRVKYQGFLSAEILPLPDPDTASEMTIKHMRQFVL
jgi:sugar phosphate isomerase/epimerase